MTDVISRLAGILLIIATFIDIYLTVLYPRNGKSILSLPLCKGIWALFRATARRLPVKNKRLLSFCGPTVVVAIVVVWVTLYILGFALFLWPALGNGIQASSGTTPTDFFTAFYYSGFAFTTLGVGDLTPKTSFYQMFTVVEAAVGFAVFTLALTYLLSVYSALIRRNAFALSLHHRMGGSPSVVKMIIRLKAYGKFEGASQEISNMADELMFLLEAHHAYPILHYFRFQENYYSLARMMLIALNLSTLIKSALSSKAYEALADSTAITQLESGSLFMLTQIRKTLVESKEGRYETTSEADWRRFYHGAVDEFRKNGLQTVIDIEAGADRYVSLRYRWQNDVATLAKYMDYQWYEVSPDGR